MRNDKKTRPAVLILEALLLAVLTVFLVLVVIKGNAANDALMNPPEPTETPTPTPAPTPTPEPTPTPVVHIDFEPHAVDGTQPDSHISVTEIMVNGELCAEFESEYDINFGTEESYTAAEGIVGFRGGNFRQGAAYGTAKLSEKSLSLAWSAETDGLSDTDGGYWSGTGWTGQPHIVKWPEATRKNITAMYDWARETKELVEVIYPAMDGCVYFFDLDSGKPTRDAMDIGNTFKGCGALDPRGYPILYLGAGLDSYNGNARAFVINLLDNSIMFEFGEKEDFAFRNWNMFDSSPLVSADTDQLIYPGENGVLYIIHLNSSYDEKTGKLAVDPDNIVKWRYNTARNTDGAYYIGFEASAAAINSYLFLADNSGYLMCLDLRTLKLVWVQDILDDTNCSPVIDIEDGHPYIYISTSFHFGLRSYYTATIPVWKIDAVTGEVVWHTDYECWSEIGLSGGVQGTIALGQNELSDMIFVSVAKTNTQSGGRLVALSKETGEEIWSYDTSTYGWSSPLAFYDVMGKGYLIHSVMGRVVYLIDGKTGTVLDEMGFNGTIEASPAMYGSRLVMGHRSGGIFCLEVK